MPLCNAMSSLKARNERNVQHRKIFNYFNTFYAPTRPTKQNMKGWEVCFTVHGDKLFKYVLCYFAAHLRVVITNKSEHVYKNSRIAQLALNLLIMIVHSFQLCIHACLHRCAVQCQKIPIRICFPSRSNKSLLSSLLIQLFQVIV